MSITMASRGGRHVMEKRSPLSVIEMFRKRDMEMYRMYVEGHTMREVGRFFNMDKSNVSLRFKAMPSAIKAEVRRDVKRTYEARKAAMAERIEAASHA